MMRCFMALALINSLMDQYMKVIMVVDVLGFV